MASRRQFIKKSVLGISSLGMLSTLASCSTFDEFIFDDRVFSKDQVLIVGGGISGLSLAYKLRQNRSEYLLFEGSTHIGGRIRSNEGLDFGASVFRQSDVSLKKLIKDFNQTEIAFSNSQFYIKDGAEQLVKVLKSRVMGLMPYRNLRLKWKLIEISKIFNGFELIFETPSGQRKIKAVKVALAIPPSQWHKVKGLLQLPEMEWATLWLKTLLAESALKIHYTSVNGVINSAANQIFNLKNDQVEESIKLITKKIKNIIGLEIEFLYKNGQPNAESLIALINSKTKLGLSTKKLTSDLIFNWSDIDLIQSAYFKNTIAVPELFKRESSNFQIFGDYSSSVKPHTVEGALLEAERVANLFI